MEYSCPSRVRGMLLDAHLTLTASESDFARKSVELGFNVACRGVGWVVWVVDGSVSWYIWTGDVTRKVYRKVQRDRWRPPAPRNSGTRAVTAPCNN
ncbi:unnamed protein product, partial [Iphiclides podalirius]